MNTFYNLSIQETLATLNSKEEGLDGEKIAELQLQHGKNVLQEAKHKSRWAILASQFTDVMIIILVIAAIISFVVGEHTDGFVILAIILGNAWLGYSQEYNAEESVRMLQNMSAQFALVLRNGKPQKIDASELVPGDIILLEAGDIVPADARLIEISSLKADEASLTGESHTIEKTNDIISDENPVPGDQLNIVFKGTIVSNGTGKAVVTATGMRSELGKIAGMMEVKQQKTPLQKRLSVFSKQLAVIVIIICLLVFGFGLWRGAEPFQMFLTALSLAVAALPEALPAVITIALAQGASRMVKQNALMRKLPAVETLGSVTFICSDKTGTLTQNIMTVEKIEIAPGKESLMQAAMMLNNEVRVNEAGELMGDSTETALVQYVQNQGLSKDKLESEYALQNKLPFDSERMRMSSLFKQGEKWVLLSKGAPGKMAEQMQPNAEQDIDSLLHKNKTWAAEGLRVLFFGYKYFDQNPGELTIEDEKDLQYLGMTAEIDPPREEVIGAIKECATAGIKTVMITGDQPLTATAIAERLGMTDEHAAGVKSGAELENISENEFNELTAKTKVYARVSPQQKLNIVKSLQENGEFVAMTGDGVNDAPSLKQADIGIAMGITGTDVSKEAADMILLDDNFATIVKAVREGRRIYENIKKFIIYVLSCNLGEILTIVCAPLLGLAMPLLPIHILWINLVTDGLPGLALVAEPAEKDIMQQPPRPPKENLFAGGLIPRILFTGVIMAAAAIYVQQWAATNGYNVLTQQTAVFTTLCFVQLGNALSVRSMYHPLISKSFFKNKGMWGAIIITVGLQLLLIYVPFMHPIFKTTTIAMPLMITILWVFAACIFAIELVKLISKSIYLKKMNIK